MPVDPRAERDRKEHERILIVRESRVRLRPEVPGREAPVDSVQRIGARRGGRIGLAVAASVCLAPFICAEATGLAVGIVAERPVDANHDCRQGKVDRPSVYPRLQPSRSEELRGELRHE